jgi:hypothetical protein
MQDMSSARVRCNSGILVDLELLFTFPCYAGAN